MATLRKGDWEGLLVCFERTVKVKLNLDIQSDGTLTGKYSFKDKKYSAEYRSGNLKGRYADNLVMMELTGHDDWIVSFHGGVHPAPPHKQEMLLGLVMSHEGNPGDDSGGLVLFSKMAPPDSLSGWDG